MYVQLLEWYHSNMDDRTCKECDELFNDAEQVRRHLRKHTMTAQEYVLKWMYNGTIPKCGCGCGGDTSWNNALKAYTTFVHGHHAWGRKKSDDEKRRIGEKNSVNMKRFMHENPEVAQLRNEQMRGGHTIEVEHRRIEAVQLTYASMTQQDKKVFSDNTKRQWENGEMYEPRARAAATWLRRFATGEYDFEERNRKLSEAISQKYVNGTWKFSKGSYTSSKMNTTSYYRSSWELRLMQELDADGDVTCWESEFTSIPYEYLGATHRYVPDFHVTRCSTGHWLVEVKPQALRITERNEAKRIVAQKYCEERGWQYSEWQPREP